MSWDQLDWPQLTDLPVPEVTEPEPQPPSATGMYQSIMRKRQVSAHGRDRVIPIIFGGGFVVCLLALPIELVNSVVGFCLWVGGLIVVAAIARSEWSAHPEPTSEENRFVRDAGERYTSEHARWLTDQRALYESRLNSQQRQSLQTQLAQARAERARQFAEDARRYAERPYREFPAAPDFSKLWQSPETGQEPRGWQVFDLGRTESRNWPEQNKGSLAHLEKQDQERKERNDYINHRTDKPPSSWWSPW